MERLKFEIKKNKVLIAFLLVNFLFYGNFVMLHYAPDTYLTEALGWRETATNYWAAGRWLMVLFLNICEMLHISFRMQQLLSWGIALLSISAASTLIYTLFCERITETEDRAKKLWIFVCSFMLVTNIFLLEDFIFAEYTGMMCLGIFFDVLGAVFVLRFLKEKRALLYAMGIAFGIMGINGHQGNFAILVVVCVLAAKDTFDNLRCFIWNNVVIGSAYLIPALVNVWQVKIGGAPRMADELNLKASFLKTTEGVYNLLLSTANFMPRKFYVSIVLVLALYFVYCVIRKRNWKAVLFGGYYFVIMFLGVYAPFIMTDVQAIDIVPRTVYVCGGIVPVILSVLLFDVEINWKKNIFIPVCIGLFLLAQYRGVLKITIGHFQANEIDRYEAQFIGNKLWAYEEETGKQVTKMALYWDANVTGMATEVIGYGPVNERALSNEWVAPLAIRCLDGKVLHQTETSEEVYKKYFEGKNWNQIEEEQMVIIGDTLHFCAY